MLLLLLSRFQLYRSLDRRQHIQPYYSDVRLSLLETPAHRHTEAVNNIDTHTTSDNRKGLPQSAKGLDTFKEILQKTYGRSKEDVSAGCRRCSCLHKRQMESMMMWLTVGWGACRFSSSTSGCAVVVHQVAA